MPPITPDMLAPLEALRPDDWRRCVSLIETSAPCSRAQFQPGHFTASAFVLHPSEPSILLIKHRKLGLWLQPGGHIHADDPSAQAAAVRELRRKLASKTFKSSENPTSSSTLMFIRSQRARMNPSTLISISASRTGHDLQAPHRRKKSPASLGRL